MSVPLPPEAWGNWKAAALARPMVNVALPLLEAQVGVASATTVTASVKVDVSPSRSVTVMA